MERAVRSLLAYFKSSKQSRLDLGPEKIVVQIGLKRTIGDPKKAEKPMVISVPHAVRDVCETRACLLVKDADKPWIKALVVDGKQPGAKAPRTSLDGTRAARMARRSEATRDQGHGEPESEEKTVGKVISLQKLRTSYARFEERRRLRDSYDVFLADDRILPMLTSVLGKSFFSRKKQPIPVDCSRPTSLKHQIRHAIASVHCVLRPGNCVALLVANTDMPVEHIVDNAYAACGHLVATSIPKQWATVLHVSLKLTNSASLPVYICDDVLPSKADAMTMKRSQLEFEDRDAAASMPKTMNLLPSRHEHGGGDVSPFRTDVKTMKRSQLKNERRNADVGSSKIDVKPIKWSELEHGQKAIVASRSSKRSSTHPAHGPSDSERRLVDHAVPPVKRKKYDQAPSEQQLPASSVAGKQRAAAKTVSLKLKLKKGRRRVG